MKSFTAITAVAIIFAGVAVAVPDTEAAQVVKRATQVVERAPAACSAAPAGCVCNQIQGQFCGIASPCKIGYVYECNASTGRACEYGPRDSCKECNKLSCP